MQKQIKYAAIAALSTITTLVAQEAKIEVFEVQPNTDQVKINWEVSGLDMSKQHWSRTITSQALFGVRGVPKLDHESGKYMLFRLSGRRTKGKDTTWKILDEKTLSSWLPQAALQIQTKEATLDYDAIDKGAVATADILRTRADWNYGWGVRTKGGANWGKIGAVGSDPSRDYAWVRRTWQSRDIETDEPIGSPVVTIRPTRIALGTDGKPTYGPNVKKSETPHWQFALAGGAPTSRSEDYLRNRRGTDKIEVYVQPVVPELPAGKTIAHFNIEVYPQTYGSVEITDDLGELHTDNVTPLIRSEFPTITFKSKNEYPRHLSYIRIFKGTASAPGTPHVFPDSVSFTNGTSLTSNHYVVPIDQIRAAVQAPTLTGGEKNGYWTIEYVHAIPTLAGFNAQDPSKVVPDTSEVIASYTFYLKANLAIRGVIQEGAK